jgi:hypothetical protein
MSKEPRRHALPAHNALARPVPGGRHDDVIGSFPGLINTINARFARL